MALDPKFTPAEFFNKALARDFSRDFQLRVLDIGNGFITEADNVFIKSATLPKYKIHNQSTDFMGMKFNIPGSAEFEGSDNWSVNFRCDLGFNIRHKIETWQQQIFTQFEQPLMPGSPNGGGTGEYNVPSMLRTVTMALHDRTGGWYRQYKLFGVYPVSFGDMKYEQNGTGKIMDLSVSLAYQWWELTQQKCPAGFQEPEPADVCP